MRSLIFLALFFCCCPFCAVSLLWSGLSRPLPPWCLRPLWCTIRPGLGRFGVPKHERGRAHCAALLGGRGGGGSTGSLFPLADSGGAVPAGRGGGHGHALGTGV